ncbi:hypothetical protein PISMIDRAFT_680135 [Pisolithus microcarpus 441]|uniref:Unplaced genomic scaffold scaffold_54, whole genome shotgun sequence n=1 Tax=Pisolithus microcarpus 441 TaxID=765257 RepID=A0A0C9Z0J6_9AGAM|nr:hypothetical protein PISMIDRAFT_680135 [Pisolithus microcarpus 441]
MDDNLVAAFGNFDEVTIFTPSRGANLFVTRYVVLVRNRNKQTTVCFLYGTGFWRRSLSTLLRISCLRILGQLIAGCLMFRAGRDKLVDAVRVLNRQSMREGMDARYWLTTPTQVSGAACDLIIKNGPVR